MLSRPVIPPASIATAAHPKTIATRWVTADDYPVYSQAQLTTGMCTKRRVVRCYQVDSETIWPWAWLLGGLLCILAHQM